MNPRVTVITPTTGSPYLMDVLNSIDKQTYDNIEHLVVVDGHEHASKVGSMMFGASRSEKINLPFPTGKDQYNGHRIYGAMTFIGSGDYFCFLDEDNWYEPNHIQTLVNTVKGYNWSYSLRKIVDENGQYICNDDCESLGKWPSILGDNFIDVGCFFIRRDMALRFAPYWYRRARHPNEQPEVDRIMSQMFLSEWPSFKTTGEYTLNYRAGNRADSVQKEFFLNGNEKMKWLMKGDFPWRKT